MRDLSRRRFCSRPRALPEMLRTAEESLREWRRACR